MPNPIRPGANAPKAPAAERRPRARRRHPLPAVPLDARRAWPPERHALQGLGRRQYAWMAGAHLHAREPELLAVPHLRPPEVLVGPQPANPQGDDRYRVRPMGEAYEHLDRNLHAFHQLLRRGQPNERPGPDAPLGGAARPPADPALADLALWHAGHHAHARLPEPQVPELHVAQALRRQIDFDLLEIVHLHEPEVWAPLQPGAQEAVIPQANSGDVHGLHRDRATRHSLARLLTRTPRYQPAVHQQRQVTEIVAYLDHHEMQASHLAASCDATGASLIDRARRALDLRCPAGFSGLLDPANTLVIDALGITTVPMATVCTVIWDAINRLEACSTIDAETAALRLERRDMFVRALASCMASTHEAFCAPGQAQRLAMVLQGCVPEVLIETYNEVCSVNQFVALTLEGLNRHLAHPAADEPERIRRYLDQSYLEGRTVYQGTKLAQLEEQLQDFVRLTFDINDWVPPRG